VAFSHAFRTEAGSSGSENRGIYRLHQFSKALGVEDWGRAKGFSEVKNTFVFGELGAKF